MTSKEIRKAFLDFFASKGHQIVPSAPMVVKNDPTLMEDVQNEREVMCSIYQKLIKDGHPLLSWYYGHFHQSYNKIYNGVNFTMLDIMEFTAILTS